MEEQTLDLTQLICDSINSIFFKFLSSIDNTIYSNLDNILFINSDITNNLKFQQFFGTESSNGLLIIVKCLIIGLVLYYNAQGKGKKYLIINALTVGVHYTAIIGFLAYFYTRNYKHDKVIKGLIIFFL